MVILARAELTHRRTGRYVPKGTPYPALVASTVNAVHQAGFGLDGTTGDAISAQTWIATGRSYAGVGPARLFDTRAGSSAA